MIKSMTGFGYSSISKKKYSIDAVSCYGRAAYAEKGRRPAGCAGGGADGEARGREGERGAGRGGGGGRARQGGSRACPGEARPRAEAERGAGRGLHALCCGLLIMNFTNSFPNSPRFREKFVNIGEKIVIFTNCRRYFLNITNH